SIGRERPCRLSSATQTPACVPAVCVGDRKQTSPAGPRQACPTAVLDRRSYRPTLGSNSPPANRRDRHLPRPPAAAWGRIDLTAATLARPLRSPVRRGQRRGASLEALSARPLGQLHKRRGVKQLAGTWHSQTSELA